MLARDDFGVVAGRDGLRCLVIVECGCGLPLRTGKADLVSWICRVNQQHRAAVSFLREPLKSQKPRSARSPTRVRWSSPSIENRSRRTAPVTGGNGEQCHPTQRGKIQPAERWSSKRIIFLTPGGLTPDEAILTSHCPSKPRCKSKPRSVSLVFSRSRGFR